MRQTLINHPKLTVRLVTGTEGPPYDPYHFDELEVTTPQRSVVVHMGLAVFAKIGKHRLRASGKDYDNPREWTSRILERFTGYSAKQIERMSRKKGRNCPTGGRHDTYSADGYPGESFEICSKCGKVVDSYFCESAII